MGQKSSIDRLDPELRRIIHELLRDGQHTQEEIRAHVNDLIAEGGGQPISRSAFNRYAVRMEEVGSKLRQMREVSQQWIGQMGTIPEGEVGRLLIEVVRGLAWDSATRLSEGEEPPPPKLIRELSVAVERLQRSAKGSVEFEREIRRQAAEDLAARAARDAVGTGGTLSAERLHEIVREAYGV